jgi:beta-glucosidase
LIFRTSMSADRPFGRFVCPEHSAVARRIASEGMVLLKNKQGLLPLKVGKFAKIAVIGENATRSLTKGGGSSELKVSYEVSPLEALKVAYGSEHILYSMGYSSGSYAWGREMEAPFNADTLSQKAIQVASQADLIVFVGGLNKNTFQDCEGEDRKSYGLPFGQAQLLAKLTSLNIPVVVVLMSGNAVSMPWLNQVSAVVQAWYMGSESGNALSDVLTGAVNPSGKLPFTFGWKLEDYGANALGTDSFPGNGTDVVYKEDLFVGYRWFDSKKIAPMFPFGFGLSYTSFEYGKLTASAKTYAAKDTIRLSLTLENTGKVDGAEVVQVYASEKKPAVPRPVKELKAFKKVWLKAGETKTVFLFVSAADLAYYDEASKGWKLNSGVYNLQVAASSADIKGNVDVIIGQ